MNVALQSNGKLAFQWRSRIRETEREALLAADVQSSVRLTPSLMRITTRVRLDMLQGHRDSFELWIPPGQMISSLTGELVRDWNLPSGTNGTNASQVKISLAKVLDGVTTIQVVAEQPLATLPSTAIIRIPRVIAAQRESGSLSISIEDLSAEIRQTTGVQQINPSDGDLVAYRIQAQPVSISLAIDRIAPQISTKDRVTLLEIGRASCRERV